MDEPTPGEIEKLAWREIEALPEEIRGQISNLGLLVEEEPPPGKRWLATFSGVPLTNQSVFRPYEYPRKITIYRGPLLRISGNDRVKLEAEIRHIVRHEIAHYFGISDERLIEIDRY